MVLFVANWKIEYDPFIGEHFQLLIMRERVCNETLL